MTATSIRAMSPEPNIKIELVTPDRARGYLGANVHNRNLRERLIDTYARDMRAGNWQWNGDAIKIAADGTLLDGQHRMAAVIRSGATVRMLVVRDLPAATQETMDTGAKRTFSDVLTLRGYQHATRLAAACRLILTWERGGRRLSLSAITYSNTELSGVVERYPWLADGMTVVDRLCRKASLPGSVAGLAYWLFMQIDPQDAEFFIDRLCSDEHHTAGDPITELRRMLLAPLSRRTGERSTPMLAALTIKAWNKYRKGETVTNLRFRMGGAAPEDFPEPI